MKVNNCYCYCCNNHSFIRIRRNQTNRTIEEINTTFTYFLSFCFLRRKCPNNKAFFSQSISGEIHQFCVEKCELITTCGEVTVPETHLDVSQCLSSYFAQWSCQCMNCTKFNEHFNPEIQCNFPLVIKQGH